MTSTTTHPQATAPACPSSDIQLIAACAAFEEANNAQTCMNENPLVSDDECQAVVDAWYRALDEIIDADEPDTEEGRAALGRVALTAIENLAENGDYGTEVEIAICALRALVGAP